MDKPLNLIMEETKNEIAKIINEAKLPAYLLKPILKDFYMQLQNLEQAELVKAKKDYEDSLKEEKTAENEE